tara:strand:- start:130 stop:486 length:357 start_codon:yes stop_codon:yes gene_type:complete
MLNKLEDLDLKELGYFNGSETFSKISLYPNVRLTEGIIYIAKNGYSWVITDCLAILKCKLSKEEFVSIKLIVENKKAQIIYTNGNEKVLYKQKYEFTDAKKNLNLFFTNNTLMLSNEY